MRTDQCHQFIELMIYIFLRDSDRALKIDPKQLYVTGISSGAGVAMNLACEAPDMFAGIGMFDGPTIGASAAMKSYNASSSYEDGLQICTDVAGDYANHFSNQIAVIAYGEESLSLPTVYSHYNVRIFAQIYGATHEDTCVHINGGASEIPWKKGSEKRAVLVVVHEMDHKWPVGADMNKNAIYNSFQYISWPQYFTKFVFENSVRVSPYKPDADGDDGVYDNRSCKKLNHVKYSTPGQVFSDFLLNSWKFDRIVKDLRMTRAAAPRCEPFLKEDEISGCKQSAIPRITMSGDNPLAISLGGSFSDPGASAMDVEDGDISANIKTYSDVRTDIPGKYRHVYHVEDSDTTTTQQTRRVVVE